ncbi:MAG: hypothetical protein J6K58_04785 [Lachnospiraceae bacterium]|nr:hypothetical protein [Lachnospiraceae bacterium]
MFEIIFCFLLNVLFIAFCVLVMLLLVLLFIFVCEIWDEFPLQGLVVILTIIVVYVTLESNGVTDLNLTDSIKKFFDLFPFTVDWLSESGLF